MILDDPDRRIMLRQKTNGIICGSIVGNNDLTY
jgi:hypothetical protein